MCEATYGGASPQIRRQRFVILGMSDDPHPFFPPAAMTAIASGKVFSGGKRHHEIVRGLLPADAEWIDITVPLDDVFARYREFEEIVVFASGEGAQERLGVEAKCYLHDPRVAELAARHGITRTQAGIRLAVEEHPDALFAFGNAPTALQEVADLIRRGKASPAGIIAAPVGFVHVQESKHAVKPFRSIPKIIVEGRKGGSNLAATLVNAILCYNDAEQLRPGRDV